jgi:hypothetical protein
MVSCVPNCSCDIGQFITKPVNHAHTLFAFFQPPGVYGRAYMYHSCLWLLLQISIQTLRSRDQLTDMTWLQVIPTFELPGPTFFAYFAQREFFLYVASHSRG